MYIAKLYYSTYLEDMCQTSVFVEKDGKEELLLEDVTRLDIGPKGLQIATLFEGSKKLEDLVLSSIDFVAGKVFLRPVG